MKKNRKGTYKSLYWFHIQGSFAALLITALLMAGFFYYFAEGLLSGSTKQALRDHANFRISQIEHFVKEQRSNISRLVADDEVRRHIEEMTEQYDLYEVSESEEDFDQLQYAAQRFRDEHQIVIEISDMTDLFLISPDGNLIFSYVEMDDEVGMDLSGSGFYGKTILSDLILSLQRQPQPQFSRFGRIPQLQEATVLVGAPVYSHNSRRLVAYLVYPVALQEVRSVMEVFIGLGETGEVVLGQLRGSGIETGVNMISSFRGGLGREPDEICQELRRSEYKRFPMLLALMQREGEGWMLDNGCIDVYAIWEWFPEMEWGMVVKQDREEILKPIYQFQQYLLFFLPIIFLGLLMIARYFATSISRPITRLTDDLQQGNVVQETQAQIEEIDQLASALKQYEESVEQANLAKDEFMASMSHELRTPLTSIIGNAEYLAEQLVVPELKEVVQSIETAGYAQLALVNDVLDMSKIESGKFTLDESPYNLERLLNDVRSMLMIRAQDAGLSLQIEQKNQESYELIGDSSRLAQILINLLSNAIKFTEQGTVKLTTWVEDGWLLFEVQDSGIGMTKEEQSRLFKKFEQADGSISRRFGGTGLGLYISLNLAHLMDGKITVQSVKGEGSTFTLMVPHRNSGVLIKHRVNEKYKTLDHNRQFDGDVLVVEDTPELQLLERRILESMGVSVEIASNGQEAIEKVANKTFDLILMDMQMPVMDGIEATRTLRAKGITTPIFALTANVMTKHRESFKAAGCDGFVAKPIEKGVLQQTLQDVLQPETGETITANCEQIERIEWGDHYSVGHPTMDAQHQKIIDGINVLVEYCLDGKQEGSHGRALMHLSSLHDLILEHIHQEERLLEQSRYPQHDAHLASHKQYWDRMAELYKNRFDEAHIEAITAHLMKWWRNHILIEDMAYKEHVETWLNQQSEVDVDSPVGINSIEAPEEVDDELMAIFKESAANYSSALKSSLANKNWEELRNTAHTIKGSSASFGFSVISKKAEAVQFTIDENNLGSVPDLANDLLFELNEIL